MGSQPEARALAASDGDAPPEVVVEVTLPPPDLLFVVGISIDRKCHRLSVNQQKFSGDWTRRITPLRGLNAELMRLWQVVQQSFDELLVGRTFDNNVERH